MRYGSAALSGIAIETLMAANEITERWAFETLRAAGRESRRKIDAVAEQVVFSKTLK
jgi:AmiR/NasT family two-component response regulator